MKWMAEVNMECKCKRSCDVGVGLMIQIPYADMGRKQGFRERWRQNRRERGGGMWSWFLVVNAAFFSLAIGAWICIYVCNTPAHGVQEMQDYYTYK